MIYEAMIGKKCYSHGYLEMTSFLDLYEDISQGFTVVPAQLHDDWSAFYFIDLSPSNHDISNTFTECRSLLSRFIGDSTPGLGALGDLGLSKLVTLLSSAAPHLGTDFRSYVISERREEYDGLIALASLPEAFSDSNLERLIQLQSGVFEHSYKFVWASKAIIEDREAFIRVFGNQNIHYASGKLNFEKIHRLLKTNFGQSNELTVVYKGLLIERLIKGDKTSPPTLIPPPNNGLSFERAVIAQYRQLGYVITETASTGDFGIDLIAQSNIDKIGIQCKHYTGNVGVEAVMQAHSGGHYYGCSRYIVFSTGGFTEAASEMAKKLGVELLVYRGAVSA